MNPRSPIPLCALLLAFGPAALAKEPEQEHHVRSEALACEARFPGRARLWRSDARYGNGACRHYHYVHDEGEDEDEVTRSLEVQRLRHEPPSAEHAVAQAHEYQARDAARVLATEKALIGGQRGLRARYLLAANEYEPERERRVQYVAVGKLLYKLSLTYPTGREGMDIAWVLFRGGFKLRAPTPTRDWVPHVSGAGGFGALFPAKPRESSRAGALELSASGAQGSRFVVTSRARSEGSKRTELFNAAYQAARAGLESVEQRSRRELGKHRREWVLAGELEGAPVTRVARVWVGKAQVISWSATGPEILAPQLEAFARCVRPLRPLDPKLLERPCESLCAATLGSGEALTGAALHVEKGGFGRARWRLRRADYRLDDERYLAKPALAEYSSHWTLHRWSEEELQLETGRGVLRTYFARDGDELLALHERVEVDAEGYRCVVIELRNRALPRALVEKALRGR